MQELMRLAWPLIIGFAGTQLMSVVDTAMVGRLGAAALSGVSIGGGIFMAGAMVGLGCVLGTDPLITQALGAKEASRAHGLMRDGVRVALLVGLPLTLILVVSAFGLARLGVPPDVADAAQRYLLGRAPNLLPFLVFAALRSYLQARGVGRPIVLAMVFGNVVNVIANSLLIFGDGTLEMFGMSGIGLPALGVLGAGLASSIAGVAAALAVWLGVRRVNREDGDVPRCEEDFRRKILALGYPIALTLLAEVGAFAITSVLAGRIGAVAGAGHQVAITIASFSFTVTLGIGAATTVLVGRAVGRGDTPGAREAGFSGLRASTLFMAVSAVVFVVLAEPLARMLSNQADVVRCAVPLVYLAAVFQISDGAQAVGAGALRGVGDTKYVQHANVIGHYAIGLPIAAALAFGADLGAPGLWGGLCAGLTVVALALILRFHRLSSRTLARV